MLALESRGIRHFGKNEMRVLTSFGGLDYIPPIGGAVGQTRSDGAPPKHLTDKREKSSDSYRKTFSFVGSLAFQRDKEDLRVFRAV
jgi:hypothetical protein